MSDLRIEYLRRLLEDFSPEKPILQEAIAESPGAAELQDSVFRGVEYLRQERPLQASDQAVLEAIIVPLLRPVADIQNDSFPDLAPPFNGISALGNRNRIETAIRAIGRIEITGLPGVPYGGTGFIVGPNLIATNRHVAELVTSAVGVGNLHFYPGRSAGLDLKQELGSRDSVLLSVRAIRMVHPYWDAAFLEVDGLLQGHPVLSLAVEPPPDLHKRLVSVIGYPAFDPRGDAHMQMKTFNGVFQKKRLQPGFTMGYRQIQSYGNIVEALAHDCSTLGGNSGSAVVDPSSGDILAIHFAGIELQCNYAVPAWQLTRDSRVVDLGVQFSGQLAVGTAPPEWMRAWDSVQSPPQVAPAPSPPPPGPKEQPLPFAPDWFERASTEDLVHALQADRTTTTSYLIRTLGPASGQALAAELTPPLEEGLFDRFDPDPDPDLPEVVWLHGIMGGHLAQRGFLRTRAWLNLAAISFGNLANSIGLASDGVSTAKTNARPLEPDGLIQTFYGPAERAWRRNRFIVHPYSFDWRKSIELLADQLHNFLERLRDQQPRKKFVLVAHSMGGLLCCMYAQRHPQWRDTVHKAVFMGTPIGGSYAPLQAVIGTYDLLRKIALLSLRNDLDSIRRMAATLPGLMDMLPAASLFPDAAAAYTTSTWPDGIVPAQKWLDQSWNLKPALLNSPLLERTTLLVSLGHATVSSLIVSNGMLTNAPPTGPGDGTVPARACAINGIPTYKVDFDHGSIPKDPKAIQAVVDLIKSGTCSLSSPQPADFAATFAVQEAPFIPEDAISAIQERFRHPALRTRDIEWLFRNGMGLPDD